MKKKISKGKKQAAQKMEKPKRNQHHLIAEAERLTKGENKREKRKAEEYWKLVQSQLEKAEKKKQRMEKKKQKEDLKETMNEVKKAIDKKDQEDQQDRKQLIRPSLNLEVDMSINKQVSENEVIATPVRINEPEVIEISDSEEDEEELKENEETTKLQSKDQDKFSSGSSEFTNEPQCFAFLFQPEQASQAKPGKRGKTDFVTACTSSEIEEMNEQAIDENIDLEGVRRVQARYDAQLNLLATQEEKFKFLMQMEVMSRDERSHESRSSLIGTRKHSAMKAASNEMDTPVKRRNN